MSAVRRRLTKRLINDADDLCNSLVDVTSVIDAIPFDLKSFSASRALSGVSNAVRQGQEEEAGGLVVRTRAMLRVHVQERRLPNL